MAPLRSLQEHQEAESAKFQRVKQQIKERKEQLARKKAEEKALREAESERRVLFFPLLTDTDENPHTAFSIFDVA